MTRKLAIAAVVALAAHAALCQSAPPPSPAFLAADVRVSPPIRFPYFNGAAVNGNRYVLRTATMADLIATAYGVDGTYVQGGPRWLERDRYDITGKLPPDSSKSSQKQMLQALLAERFKLVVHTGSKPLPAYVLSVAKGGSKLMPSESKGPLGGMFFGAAQGGLSLRVQNSTISDLAQLMQVTLVDRPIVDQTGLTGRYDTVLTFMPDESQFNGHPPQIKVPDGVEAAPSLFEALPEQLGLKLTPEKTQVTVMVIDHAQKPSAN